MNSLVRLQPVDAILKRQAGVLVVIFLAVFFWQGLVIAIAAVYGGLIAVSNTVLMRWHLLQAAKTAGADAGLNLRKAYSCVAQRWVLTFALFTIGFAVLALQPLPLLIGFTGLQLMLFGHMNRARNQTWLEKRLLHLNISSITYKI